MPLLYPIPGVPISVEVVKNYIMQPDNKALQIQPKSLLDHTGKTLRSVWNFIPKIDREVMISDMAKYTNKRLSIWIIKNWHSHYKTNAFIQATQDGVIAIDAGYAGVADTEHLGSTIAHELAHYCDFSRDNSSDLSEETACYIADISWGFPLSSAIYQCEQCRKLDRALKRRGIAGKIFDSQNFGFVYLPSGRRLTLKEDFVLLKDTPESSLSHLLSSDIALSFRSEADKTRNDRYRQKEMKRLEKYH